MSNRTFADALRRFMADFDRGAFTALETVARVIESMGPEDAPEVVRLVSTPISDQLRDRVNNLPHTDEEWEKAEFFYISSEGEAPGNWSKDSYREKIEALRRSLGESK